MCTEQSNVYFSCDRVTNPHLNPTDLKYNIRIRQIQILAGCVTSLACTVYIMHVYCCMYLSDMIVDVTAQVCHVVQCDLKRFSLKVKCITAAKRKAIFAQHPAPHDTKQSLNFISAVFQLNLCHPFAPLALFST